MVRGLDALFGRSAEPRPPPRAPSPHEAQAAVYTSAPAASAASAVSASTSTAPLPRIDAAEAQYWEYPEAGTGSEFRSYQHVMTREALAANTLVSLPTGFGKTFVAAAVMRNFMRWFPDGLVVFHGADAAAGPSRQASKIRPIARRTKTPTGGCGPAPPATSISAQ